MDNPFAPDTVAWGQEVRAAHRDSRPIHRVMLDPACLGHTTRYTLPEMTELTKNTRILLISFIPRLANQGLAYIAATLSHAGFPVTTLTVPQPLLQSQDLQALVNFCTELQPHWVGMSLMTPDLPRAQAVTAALQQARPDMPVVWGGIHPTLAPDDCLQYADMVCVGEGEATALELAERFEQGRDVADIAGLHLRREGQILRNPLRPYAPDLDAIPFPRQDREHWHVLTHDGAVQQVTDTLFRQHAAYDGTSVTVMTTRGCPFNCSYCCNHSIQQLYAAIGEGQHIRRRSVANVMAELEHARDRIDGLKMVVFSDDSFLLVKEDAWLEEFCRQYRDRIGLPFFCKAIPRWVTQERIRLLQQAGLEQIEIGLEANERVNREVFHRRQSDAAFVAAARVLEEAGIVRHYDVILHNPYMTEQDLVCTAEILLSLRKPFSVNYYPLTFFPGTALHERAAEDGIPHAEPDEVRWDKPVAGLPSNYQHFTRVFFLIPFLPAGVLRHFLRHPNSWWGRAGLATISVSYLSVLQRLMRMLKRKPWLYYRIIKPLYRAADRLGGARQNPA
jgi:anaerobic magnesium-protoporphyrin IX monomethyl ester cyclase